ncbi:hypothetical protein ROG8370_01518 [Roseovarius gaetbuli]|uniref:Uncharacterized protein n=1 Tax=Roseovarius gaetbuli TaxID=1356575 RepID=A0A1X6Z0X0_9RHOB|nr:hypothetical protein [Roseovarius gaetbuli]SLN36707.1 hypothetical protein ROG8370_01518 [Roseovarius gaetbuli]
MAAQDKQQLHGSNRSVNIAEALSARVKDPLWFLVRQWQTGEFEAENGGALAEIEVKSRHFPVTHLQRQGKPQEVDRRQPLERFVEAEDSEDSDASAWRREALEYEFGLSTTGHQLQASEYSGFQLDWYQFDLVETFEDATPIDDDPQTFVPTQMTFRGAPDPRWWKIEDAGAYFDSPREAEPSILSTLLPEFFYTDINKWYMIPAPMPTGSVREIGSLKVTDSFGVTTTLKPIEDKAWRVFALDPAAGKGGCRAPLSLRRISRLMCFTTTSLKMCVSCVMNRPTWFGPRSMPIPPRTVTRSAMAIRRAVVTAKVTPLRRSPVFG